MSCLCGLVGVRGVVFANTTAIRVLIQGKQEGDSTQYHSVGRVGSNFRQFLLGIFKHSIIWEEVS